VFFVAVVCRLAFFGYFRRTSATALSSSNLLDFVDARYHRNRCAAVIRARTRSPVIGDTAEGACKKRALVDSLVHPDSGVTSVSIALGYDASQFDLDGPCPKSRRATPARAVASRLSSALAATI